MSSGCSSAEELCRADGAYRSRDYAVAFEIYLRLGEAGHVESQLMVAWMLLNGLGVAQDEAAAANWYAQSAALGSPQGGFYFGRYLTKRGRQQEARSHYLASAQAGFLPAIFWMGYTAARGQGTAVSIDEAYLYLLKAARQGHMHALREVGVLDMQGSRGALWRVIGVIEFIAAVFGAFLLGLVVRDSVLLRA